MKVLYFFLSTFICYIFPVLAQEQKKVDSLLKEYHNTTAIADKVDVLDDLIDMYVYTQPNEAKKYIDEMLAISEKAHYKHGLLRVEFCLGHYYSTLGQMNLGVKYYRNALKLSYEQNDDTFLATLLKNLAVYEEHLGNHGKAIALMDSSATYQLSYGDYVRYGSAMNLIGFNYYEMGNFPKAMDYYNKALRTMDTIDIKTYHKADTHRNVGYLQTVQERYDDALHSFQLAMEVYEATDDHLYQATTLLDIGDVYASKEDNLKAITFYNKGLHLGQTYSFPTVEVYAYSGLGNAYKKLGDLGKAIPYLNKCLTTELAEVSQINRITYNYNLGNAYTLNNELNKALKHLNKAVYLSDSLNISKKLKEALFYRSKLYEKKGELRKALTDLKRSTTINDSIFSLEKAKQVNKLQTLYETEKKEAEIAVQQEEIKTLHEKAKVYKLTKGLYAGGMFTFVAVSGLLYFGFKQRMKKNKIAREKQEAIYKQEIEHKKKELASQTLHLVQKSTFLQELKVNLEKLRNSPDKFKVEFRRIVMLLKKQSAEDKDWEVFKTYFSEVHNDFDQKLKTIYPDISEKEIRLAAFLRMNLTTKEIAATLNVLPDSILKSKYRLKKKLALKKQTDLSSFLSSI
ncbi:tetratricopeptide repeat protein [Maribacter sp. LLG6340-A2]|uniref:tetratricopeptide repeat protein n=1 Tax=Maribacter sp. LLG6340-A2 TaxID=3160834 RepID=UPI003866AA20